MKAIWWKVLPITLFTLGIAVTPLAVVACSSTDQPATPEQTPETTKNVYQPSPAIQAKFSKADFDIYCQGFEYAPSELVKQSVKLIDDELTLTTLYTNMKTGTFQQENKVIMKLSAPHKLEKWEGSVIKETTTLSLEKLTQYIKTFYNYGVNPSESDNYYNPAPEVEALFTRDDFKVFSKGWSFSFGSVIKNNPAVLDGYNLYLTSMVKIEALNELVPVLTKYSYGQ